MRINLLSFLLFVLLALAPGADAQIGGSSFIFAGGLSCSYVPPLDANPGAVAYGFRKLRTGYAGKAVQLQRSSDSATQDIGFTSSCNFDTSSATAFCAATTCSVKIWYDQSGNGNNLTQATLGNQPTVTLSCQNSQPCAVFNGTSDGFAATLGSSVGANTMAAVASIAVGTGSCGGSNTCFVALMTDGTNSDWIGYRALSSACADVRQVGATVGRGTEACAANTFYRMIGTSNNTLSSIYLNGTLGTNDTTSMTLVAQTAFTLGVGAGASANWLNGKISEYIMFAPDLSIGNSNSISSNQGSYWGL
jgi:hypothetical protein